MTLLALAMHLIQQSRPLFLDLFRSEAFADKLKVLLHLADSYLTLSHAC